MALTLRIRDDFWDHSAVSLEVDSINLEQLRDLNTDEISRTLIWQGNTQIPLAEAFDVSGSLSDSCLVWQGELSRVHWIGAKLGSGSVRVDGSAGRHVGSQMSGGQIEVAQDVGDFAGVEMTGGTLRVGGNAGDRVGARYPGSDYGMNRGFISVAGNVGKGLGENMRRGTLLVQGNAGDAVGWNMLAGTICVMGTMGRFPGAGMVRGSVVCAGDRPSDILPTFLPGPVVAKPQWLRILARWLERQNLGQPGLLEPQYRLLAGDLLYGGRGELWVTSD